MSKITIGNTIQTVKYNALVIPKIVQFKAGFGSFP